MLWMLLVTASAQTRGAEFEPGYDLYMRSVESVGTPVRPGSGGGTSSGPNGSPSLQIMPGVVGFMNPVSGISQGGYLAAINTQVAPPHYTEALVGLDASALTDMHTYGFVLSFEDILASNDEAGMDAFLAELRAQDLAAAPITYTGTTMGVTNKKTLTAADIPLLHDFHKASPFYDLWTFRLTQNNVEVGWMMRERFIMADGSHWYRDFWHLKANYLQVMGGVPDVWALPWGNYNTYKQFVASLPLNQIAGYQMTTLYTQGPLSAIAP